MSTNSRYAATMASKDEEILRVWSELFVGHALAVRAVEAQMSSKAPLTINEYDVMLCISRSLGQRIRLSALADTAIYTKSGITRVIKRLEHEGYVFREECPADKRGSFAILTDNGKQALKETWRWYSAAILKIFGPCFSHAEAQKLRELLGRLVEKLSVPELVQIRSSQRR
jgi:DNA-binding MarR family transcriptional regulator